jgi:hypothetical protein
VLQVRCIAVGSTTKKISPSEINFPCHTILVGLELLIRGPDPQICIYIADGSFCQFLLDTQFAQLVEKVCDITYHVCKKGAAPRYIK